MGVTPKSQDKFKEFEQSTRLIRWATILMVFATFPYTSEQAGYVYAMLLVAALYNAGRYIPFIHQFKSYRSPIAILLMDILFAGALIVLSDNINTTYSAFLVFMIITSAYLYQMWGVILVAAVEGLILLATVKLHLYAPIQLGEVRTIALTFYALLAFGYLVSRLTHIDRVERNNLLNLHRTSEQERTLLETLVDTLNSAIFVLDSSGNIVQHNEAARLLLGKKDGVVGQDFDVVLPLHKRNNPNGRHINILQDSSSVRHRRDLSYGSDPATMMDLDISVTPVHEEDKETQYIVVCEDISNERSLDEQRTSFISVASHELRTPLAFVEAALQSALVTKEKLPIQLIQILGQAHRNTLQLANIVKDLTILAEAQNDSIPVHLTEVNAHDVLNECITDFLPQATQKGLEIAKEVKPDTPTVLTTEHFVYEILQNYITNAIKYSDKGTIKLVAEPSANGGILFSVHDKGVGISPANQKMLFTKFFRAEDFRTRSTGGSGLGLYLCSELAERLNAKVWCKSQLNEGSTFYLALPSQSNIRHDQAETVQ